MPTPILILSDAPDSGTGLGRITKDLAYLLSTMPEFRVATYGRGGNGSRHLPWIQYTFDETRQWGESELIKVCQDFSRVDPFIIFTIWDASRLFWFGHPESLPTTEPLSSFLQSGKFKRWGYFPIDGHGVEGKLSILSQETLKGYDRTLAYSKFGQTVIDSQDWIPHGIDPSVFFPMAKEEGRTMLGVGARDKLVGCVMTNQARKDWGVWAQMARTLISIDSTIKFWAHVDLLERHWSLPALIADFGLENHVRITQSLTDEALNQCYNACDVTVLPSLGEGFGYTIAESLACGVPVIHHDYAAGSELIQDSYDVVQNHEMTRLDTLHNLFRPTLDPGYFARHVLYRLENPKNATEVRDSVSHLFWDNLTPVWKNWFKKGLNG